MKHISKKLNIFVILLAMVMMMVACSSNQNEDGQTTNQEQTTKQEETELIISAAASMKDVMEEIQILYQEANPQVKLTYNFASSGSLQQQIEQGAPVDMFISASQGKMDALEEKNLIVNETRKYLLENKIVLIVPIDNTEITDFVDLNTDKVEQFAMGQPESVPAGQYASEVLAYLDITEDMVPKTVQGKDVREVLTWVATGNVDAGMVYATDAAITEDVKIVASAPEGAHSPIVYPMAVIKASENQEAVLEFMAFITTDEIQELLESYGFSPIA